VLPGAEPTEFDPGRSQKSPASESQPSGFFSRAIRPARHVSIERA
jgi:hypothetical protein